MDEPACLSLQQLNALIRQAVASGLPDTYWVQAEISELHVNNGHCYLELVQKEPRRDAIIAKARGMIWSKVFGMLKPYFEQATGQALAAGIKVLVSVQVTFHEVYGFSLTIVDIDPSFTLGDLAMRRKEILSRLEEDGTIDMNKELPFPLLPQRIAVIGSATSAGYGDFCDQLASNSSHYRFKVTLFPAVMQGLELEQSVLAALDAINAVVDDYDVVVILRGGGATSDLRGFDTYRLASACAQFPLPIITGIGHQRDDTVLDAVAFRRVKTPTAAAEYLIAAVDKTAGMLDELTARLWQGALALLSRGNEQLLRLQSRIGIGTNERLRRETVRLQTLQHRFMQGAQLLLKGEQHSLQLLQQHITDASPSRLLERGYSITISNGKIVRRASDVVCGDKLITILGSGELTSAVEDIRTRKNKRFNQ